MKRGVLIFFFAICTINQYAQFITLSFTAKDSTTKGSIELDSVRVNNLTVGCDTLLAGSNPQLILSSYVGIPGRNSESYSSLKVMPNFPNPFSNTTIVTVFTQTDSRLSLALSDIAGKNVANFTNTFEPGYHDFEIGSFGSGLLILNVFCNHEKKTLKLVSTSIEKREGYIKYLGDTKKNPEFKSAPNTAATVFQYTEGDQLQYTGLAKGYVDAILMDSPVVSTTYIFNMSAKVESVVVSPASDTIEIGETLQLTATLKDITGKTLTGRSVNWSSNNLNVATVSSSGLVTGISEGESITIMATSEGQSGTAQVTVIRASVASVVVTPLSKDIVIGDSLQLSATILDTRGISLTDRAVTWTSSNSDIATISNSGLLKGLKSGGPITITATSEGQYGTSQVIVKFPAGVDIMFDNLSNIISWALDYNQKLLINNPHIAAQIEAKTEMLKNPTLSNVIIDGNFYSTDNVTSKDNRLFSFSTVFPSENMRSGANQVVISTKLALPLLEEFMDTPIPVDGLYIWYGFNMGMLNGGSNLYMEDQETYEARSAPGSMPYEAILFHEISHCYVGNEALTQFLDLYLYNLIHTNSSNVNSWIFLQDYTAWQDSNTWVYALLDIYQLIGLDGMMKAYKIIHSYNPPYGVPLSTECKQAFIDQAPTDVKDQVIVKVEAID